MWSFQLRLAVPPSAWVLAELGEAAEALNRIRTGEQLLERYAASGVVAALGRRYHALGRACLLLGRLDEARRLGDRAIESSLNNLGRGRWFRLSRPTPTKPWLRRRRPVHRPLRQVVHPRKNEERDVGKGD
jgi:tetratricopeptide (TPR) repeat protein